MCSSDLYRALANNIVIGITKGFVRQLEINGVGYKAAAKGQVLELSLNIAIVVCETAEIRIGCRIPG